MMDKKIETISDQAATVEVSEPELLAQAFRDYERFELVLHRAGEASLKQQRDVVRAGDVVGVLAVDVARDEVVLIRQFRLAAHLANGNGDMIEIVAVDPSRRYAVADVLDRP